MAKAEQVLVLNPSIELKFIGPFTDVVTAELKLSNPTDRKVCFKVKTTAPKRYCVRPNSGIIDPGTTVSVAVMLQPFDYDPNEKNKHKFMVQTMFAPDGPIENQENVWKDIPPENLMDSKLKCVFELPTETAQSPQSADQSNDDFRNPMKASPEKLMSPKTQSVDTGDLKGTLEECSRLRGEVKQLQQENYKLKEDGTRLRKLTLTQTTSSTPPPVSQPSLEESPGIPSFLYLIATFVLGYFIAKFIL